MKGFKIVKFVTDSPAQAAGLEIGDIITSFGPDLPADQVFEISEQVVIPEDGIELTVMRGTSIFTRVVSGESFGFGVVRIDCPQSPIFSGEVQNKYTGARAIATFSGILGWLCAIAGVFSTLFMMFDNQEVSVLTVLAPLSVSLFGMFLIQQSQVIKAITDSAKSQAQTVVLLQEMLRNK